MKRGYLPRSLDENVDLLSDDYKIRKQAKSFKFEEICWQACGTTGIKFELMTFLEVDQELASEIIPSKDDVSVMKIRTHSGQHVSAYTVDGSPLFFQVETKLYPTVYMLWKSPDILPVFTTWPNVFEKLRGGADLMLPGIIQAASQQVGLDEEFEKEQMCSVVLLGNRAPIAVGYTAVSSSEAREQGMRGKGVIILHSYLDHLWSQGSKCDIPSIPPTLNTSPSARQDSENIQADVVEPGSNENFASTSIGFGGENGAIIDVAGNGHGIECSDSLCEKMNSVEIAEHADIELSRSLNDSETSSKKIVTDLLSTSNENTEEACIGDMKSATLDADAGNCCPADAMDKLLEISLLHALHCIKPRELPILTSTFYKNYLLPCCPQGQTLEIKRSSYKKLTKFLQVMEKRGFIAIKEPSKGVHCIDDVNWAHEDLKTFKKENSDIINEKQQNDNESIPNAKYQPPEIEDVFAVSGSTRCFFETQGYGKGTILSGKDVRQVVTDYIKSQELASPQNKRMVKLDPVLFSLVHKKGEDNYDSMAWDEVFKRIVDRMNPCHTVTFSGQAPVTRKGKLERIEVKVEQRMGNKKVTLVHNLEYYGIDPAEFSHKLQLKAASSTSVSQLPGKSNPGQQVLIQGNQMLYVSRTLQDDYQIAPKYINGLDKLKQSKNKNNKK